jgi:riboflavin synthase
MFTGLVSDVGEVASVEARGKLMRVRLLSSYAPETIALGASIACGGPCLTVVGKGVLGDKTWFDIDIATETLARTTATRWKPGEKLNLERSLKLGDELGGHIVTGHIDGIAEILAIDDLDGMKRIVLRSPPTLARLIAEKGSVSLDGVSLTVNSVEGDIFSVLLIPHTLQVTTWSQKSVGDAVNLEVDLMARYAARLSEHPARP